MRILLLILLLFTSCSTIKNTNTVLNTTTDTLTNNVQPTLVSIKNTSDSISGVITNNFVNTLDNLNKDILSAQILISNVNVLIKETSLLMSNANVDMLTTKELIEQTKLTIVDSRKLLSNDLSIITIQSTQTISAVNDTISDIHDSQQDYHKFIINNWGKIVVIIISLILLSIFHTLLQRLIFGKNN